MSFCPIGTFHTHYISSLFKASQHQLIANIHLAMNVSNTSIQLSTLLLSVLFAVIVPRSVELPQKHLSQIEMLSNKKSSWQRGQYSPLSIIRLCNCISDVL